MKRINIALSDELAEEIEGLAERKEMSVAEIARRSLELYLQRFPKRTATPTRLPAFNLGRPLKSDFKEMVYKNRVREIVK